MAAKKSSRKKGHKKSERIVVKDGKYKDHTRARPVVKSPKRKAALKKHSGMTPVINQLGSQLNRIIGARVDNFKDTGFYHAMLKRFRRAEANSRVILLRQLNGLDINSKYTMDKLGFCFAHVTASGNDLTVVLKHFVSPKIRGYKPDCYCFELLLVYWDKKQQPATAEARSEWMAIDGNEKLIDLFMPGLKVALQWVLVVRLLVGKGNEPIGLMASQAMKIMEAGSFDKKDSKLLK